MLRCNVKGVEKGYPLRIEPVTTEIIESPYDPGNLLISVNLMILDMVRAMLRKIDFECLKSAANDLSIPNIQEHQQPINPDECDEIFLRLIHHLLFELHIIEGNLVCPESGSSYLFSKIFFHCIIRSKVPYLSRYTEYVTT